ncbi:hypothetical protein [Allosphingosinicella indica]|uniref:Uncharacterized protein n=1 Tax=Allosphingosinicella indica TaxID=941907 RepID=A0A1X7FZA4_9SPHN|nr:hypothetical protein [Allosphingosinicella indica]SMF61422.1 hypothetical protein SAMN06295910_0410 [Allosphingosinicella indica]
MKMLLAAIALTIAAPAVAQADAHANHSAAEHARHQGQDCCAEKDPAKRKACCEKAAKNGQQPACCADKKADHSGHDKH